jgi:mannitol operon transcriptional antiterminator
VDTLAKELSSSRRTVFRELKNAVPLLSSFNLKITSVPGKGGLFLTGGREAIYKLKDALSNYEKRPLSKKERQLKLTINLIENHGNTQKLFYYADNLGTNVSSVSRDLDELNPWFNLRGLSVKKTKGLGVYSTGTEKQLRCSLVSSIMHIGDYEGKPLTPFLSFPGEDIEKGVKEIILSKEKSLSWMTMESLTLIELYLFVLVRRVKDRRGLVSTPEKTAVDSDTYKNAGDTSDSKDSSSFSQTGQTGQTASQTSLERSIAAMLINELQEKFNLKFTIAEIEHLALWIGACRSNKDFSFSPDESEEKAFLENLAMRLIDRFDPKMGAILKNNEEFVRLLTWHLRSTQIRLNLGIYLPNPIEKELIKTYPEVYQKTLKAAKVLEERFDKKVESNEVTFIQVHFLAALFLLGEKSARRRVLMVGIICEAGIGTSYMLAYQIKKKFQGELEATVASVDDSKALDNVDFVISTIPLVDLAKPHVLVATIMGEDDFRKIEELINTLAYTEPEETKTVKPLTKRLDDLLSFITDSRTILESFQVEKIRGDTSFENLCQFLVNRFTPFNPEAIFDALMNREKISTQVISELEIVLLHALTEYAHTPVVTIVVPDGGVFTDKYFKDAKSAIFMILPKSSGKDTNNLMGRISANLVDNPTFLQAVQNGEKDEVKAFFEREIENILAG